jgi:hypothetical protein
MLLATDNSSYTSQGAAVDSRTQHSRKERNVLTLFQERCPTLASMCTALLSGTVHWYDPAVPIASQCLTVKQMYICSGAGAAAASTTQHYNYAAGNCCASHFMGSLFSKVLLHA